jgi:hypothetical protein
VSADAATAAGETLRVVPAGGDELDRRYGADAWQASELGVAAPRGQGAVSFAGSARRGCAAPSKPGLANGWPLAARSTRSAVEPLLSNASRAFSPAASRR